MCMCDAHANDHNSGFAQGEGTLTLGCPAIQNASLEPLGEHVMSNIAKHATHTSRRLILQPETTALCLRESDRATP
jgi:hypothetical protein